MAAQSSVTKLHIFGNISAILCLSTVRKMYVKDKIININRNTILYHTYKLNQIIALKEYCIL